jgi:hypothetical protein
MPLNGIPPWLADQRACTRFVAPVLDAEPVQLAK